MRRRGLRWVAVLVCLAVPEIAAAQSALDGEPVVTDVALIDPHTFRAVAARLPDGQTPRIDDRLDIGAGELDEAQLGPEGVLAHEFGVDADEFVFCQALAQFGQRFCRRNQFVYFHRTRFWFGRSAAHGPDRPKTTGRAQP